MASAVMNLVATSSSRVRELPIKNGQLVFIQDVGRIAFDYKDTRVFYNQIVELETEQPLMITPELLHLATIPAALPPSSAVVTAELAT